MKIDELVRLYSKYGFEAKKSNPDVAVFGIQQGRYYGVDIIPLHSGVNTESIESEYKKAGYAVNKISDLSYEKIDLSLFESFFSYESTVNILRSRYNDYTQTRNDKLAIEYIYIPCPYTMIDHAAVDNSEIDIDESILQTLLKDGPQLVILEAAASYGKTATAYQVLNRFLSCGDKKTPLFSELYKNRQARIFRHILLDEKEHLFPHLKADLVIEEIKNGRVPVIIDGFDELLLKSREDDSSENFEEVGSMLATIGELLEGNAKILLTTRKTALFAGDEFYEWMLTNEEKFSITRYEIHKPDIKKWIGHDKVSYLERSDIPIHSIASPVLLTHIRSMTEGTFKEKCKKVELLINDFFDSILNREQERQDLHLDNMKQIKILSNLAGIFAVLGITSEQKILITDFIREGNELLLTETLLTYPQTQRPTMDELVEKLSNHALLDRIGSQDDNIGFLNDFVFGYLIGEQALNEDLRWLREVFLNEFFVNLMTFAFGILKNEKSTMLLEKITAIFADLPPLTQLLVEKTMKTSLEGSYRGQTFDKMDFASLIIEKKDCFIECVFNECTFEDLTIHKKALSRVSFTACSFINCTVIEDGDDENGAWFFGISEIGENVETLLAFTPPTQILPTNGESYPYEKIVLRNIAPKGRPNVAIKRPIRTLYRGVRPDQKRHIPDAIESLKKRGFITFDEKNAYINRERLAEINEFMGDE